MLIIDKVCVFRIYKEHLQINKKREKKKAKAKNQIMEKEIETGTTTPLVISRSGRRPHTASVRPAGKGARAGPDVDRGGRFGSHHVGVWAGRTGRLQRGHVAVQGLP